MGKAHDEPGLVYIFKKLQPDIFNHPVWVYFIEGHPHPYESTVCLLNVQIQQMLASDDFSGAFQALLLCAGLQKKHLDYQGALDSIEQARLLAELHRLPQFVLWATWGSCVLYALMGQCDQAAQNLAWISSHLTGKKSWIIANLLEVIGTALTSQSEDGNLLEDVLPWLERWGTPFDISRPVNSEIILSPDSRGKHLPGDPRKKPHFLAPWRNSWQVLREIIHGDLRLQWVRSAQYLNHNELKQAPDQKGHDLATFDFPPIEIELPPEEHTLVQPLPPEASAGLEELWAEIPPVAESPLLETPTNDLCVDTASVSTEILSELHPVPKQERVAKLSARAERSREDITPSLIVYCLGPFRVFQDEQPVEDWPSSKGKAVFKYLIMHRDRPVAKDVLMERFWPDTPSESARNNLNVAVYGLRQALRKTRPFYSHVLFTDDCYLLNPDIYFWLDYEAFLQYITQAGKLEKEEDLEAAISEYSKAEALYQGEFLEEDRYEDWLIPQREQLQEDYLCLLDRLNRYYFENQDYQSCITLCRKMLAIDLCREEAHRYLMQCYFERGQPYMALRQYHLCVEALKGELKVAPSLATRELYEFIHRKSHI